MNSKEIRVLKSRMEYFKSEHNKYYQLYHKEWKRRQNAEDLLKSRDDNEDQELIRLREFKDKYINKLKELAKLKCKGLPCSCACIYCSADKELQALAPAEEVHPLKEVYDEALQDWNNKPIKE